MDFVADCGSQPHSCHVSEVRRGAARMEMIVPGDFDVAAAIAEQFPDQDFSIIDRTSFAVMQRLGSVHAGGRTPRADVEEQQSPATKSEQAAGERRSSSFIRQRYDNQENGCRPSDVGEICRTYPHEQTDQSEAAPRFAG